MRKTALQDLVRINMGVSYNGTINVQIGVPGGGRIPLLPVGNKHIRLKFKSKQTLPAKVRKVIDALDNMEEIAGTISQRAEHPLSGKITYDLHMPMEHAKKLFPEAERIEI